MNLRRTLFRRILVWLTVLAVMAGVLLPAETVAAGTSNIEDFIVGYWLSVGDYGFGQAQPGSVVWFDGEHACFYSPYDTYSIEQDGDHYVLNCKNILWGDVQTFRVDVVDDNNIVLNFRGNSSDNTYLSRCDENGNLISTPYAGTLEEPEKEPEEEPKAEETPKEETEAPKKEDNRQKKSVLLTGKGSNDYIDLGENLDGYVNKLIKKKKSTVYNPDLALLLIGLCNAVYDKDTIREDIDRLGYTAKGTWGYTDDSSISYAIGIKVYDDRPQEVLIVVKGTENIEEIKRDINKGMGALSFPHWHEGFSDASQEILDTIHNTVTNPKEATYIITGFSLGAGTSNLLSVRLSDMGVPKKNVYNYNFACPDVAVGLGTGWNFFGDHDNMFNLGHCKDLITVVPGAICDFFEANTVNSWGKFGKSLWYSKDWNNAEETKLDYAFWNFKYHNQGEYLKYFKENRSRGVDQFKGYDQWHVKNAGNNIGAFANWLGIGVHCPVDVVIKDDEGKEIASVVDGEIHYSSDYMENAWAVTDGDAKNFIVPVQEVTVEALGTGEGTMDIQIWGGQMAADPVLLSEYKEVAVEEGKNFKCSVTEPNENYQTRLISYYDDSSDYKVVDRKGKEHQDDGKAADGRIHKKPGWIKWVVIIAVIIIVVIAAVLIIDSIRHNMRQKKKGFKHTGRKRR